MKISDFTGWRRMFEEAFGPRAGLIIWRGLVIAGVILYFFINGENLAFNINSHWFTSKSDSKASTRSLTKSQMLTLKEGVIFGANIVVIPLLPGEPHSFAESISGIFASAGAKAKISTGNYIINGQKGIIVYFDHSNPVSISIFTALRNAELSPIDGGNEPDSSITTIKIGPIGSSN